MHGFGADRGDDVDIPRAPRTRGPDEDGRPPTIERKLLPGWCGSEAKWNSALLNVLPKFESGLGTAQALGATAAAWAGGDAAACARFLEALYRRVVEGAPPSARDLAAKADRVRLATLSNETFPAATISVPSTNAGGPRRTLLALHAEAASRKRRLDRSLRGVAALAASARGAALRTGVQRWTARLAAPAPSQMPLAGLLRVTFVGPRSPPTAASTPGGAWWRGPARRAPFCAARDARARAGAEPVLGWQARAKTTFDADAATRAELGDAGLELGAAAAATLLAGVLRRTGRRVAKTFSPETAWPKMRLVAPWAAPVIAWADAEPWLLASVDRPGGQRAFETRLLRARSARARL